jgi:hypothetical protein
VLTRPMVIVYRLRWGFSAGESCGGPSRLGREGFSVHAFRLGRKRRSRRAPRTGFPAGYRRRRGRKGRKGLLLLRPPGRKGPTLPPQAGARAVRCSSAAPVRRVLPRRVAPRAAAGAAFNPLRRAPWPSQGTGAQAPIAWR